MGMDETAAERQRESETAADKRYIRADVRTIVIDGNGRGDRRSGRKGKRFVRTIR